MRLAPSFLVSIRQAADIPQRCAFVAWFLLLPSAQILCGSALLSLRRPLSSCSRRLLYFRYPPSGRFSHEPVLFAFAGTLAIRAWSSAFCDRFADALDARQDVADTVSGMSLGAVAAAAWLFYTFCKT
jgi:hypothetical protein